MTAVGGWCLVTEGMAGGNKRHGGMVGAHLWALAAVAHRGAACAVGSLLTLGGKEG